MGTQIFKISMRSIFNSLGSNYSIPFISTSLWSIFGSKKSDLFRLEQLLIEKYSRKEETVSVFTVYKGRDAIEVALKILLEKGDAVITQAFSCYAVEEGILRAGMRPVYADIDSDTTNASVTTLEEAFKKDKKVKAVLIQHSLGIPADSVAIRNWCKKNGLLLIEDVAQGIGGVDKNGESLGLHADAVVLSFGKDKIVDAISGGAVVFKNSNPALAEKVEDFRKTISQVPFVYVYEDLIYPDITSFIRKTHHFGFGKILMVTCKFLGLLGSPIKSKTDTVTAMHPAYAKLALLQFTNLERQVLHRRRMAETYFKLLHETSLEPLFDISELKRASNLRFSVRCKDLEEVNFLIAELKKQRIYVSDRWYRSAVDCGSFNCKTVYKNGSCKNAEDLSQQILNLPTHREMDERKVQKICRIISESLGKR